VVVPVSLSFVRAPAHPGYPGLKGRKMVVVVVVVFRSKSLTILKLSYDSDVLFLVLFLFIRPTRGLTRFLKFLKRSICRLFICLII